ncbi:MAG: hypothetical protein EBS05_23895, partial [Proteobacteria bacterium]|nr:hypothetical protein [Pseudomonadota bacterium]
MKPSAFRLPFFLFLILILLIPPAHAQVLLNVDFGVGATSAKSGFAATGLATNDFWNLHAHYNPRFTPGQALEPGRYHFHLYGHADPDATAEQNSVFTLRSGTNTFGPLTAAPGPGWKVAQGWQEGRQFVVFRDVPVEKGQPVIIEVAPGPGGVAVLNGLQIITRGSGPPKTLGLATQPAPATYTNLIVREVRYEGKVTDTEARFTATVEVESLTTNEVSAVLFEGDIAVFAPELPVGVR